MSPEIEDKALVWFDKREPVKAGDLVVIYRRPDLVPAGQHQAQVKRLVLNIMAGVTFPHRDHPGSEVVPVIIAEMLNPKRQFSIRCSDVLAVHKCMGLLPEERAVPAEPLRRTRRAVAAGDGNG